MDASRRTTLMELARYLVAGLVNTAVGYVGFLIGYYGLSLNAATANLLGYVVGFGSAFLLNRYFVFTSARIDARTTVRFVLAVAVAFVINQIVLFLLLMVPNLHVAFAQVIAMGVYTLCLFGLNKVFVYTSRPSSSDASGAIS